MTILDTATTVARKGALAYVGALALTGDVARDTFTQLTERGASAEQTARAELRRLTRMVRRDASEAVAEGEEQVSEARSLLAEGRDRVLDTLLLPTQRSLHELNNQVERLSVAIDDLRAKTRRQKAAIPAEPIPGYEKMNVDTVLSRLPKLEEAHLLAVQSYEQAHQNRITVLRAVERAIIELQAARGALAEPATRTSVEPMPGYEGLRAEEAIEKLAGLNAAELQHVYVYEQEHQNRVTVLRAVEERLAASAE